MRVPKWLFFFLHRNTKFYSCTQTVISSFIVKYEILQFYSSGNLSFCSEIQHFENYTLTTIGFFKVKYKILKTVPKQPFVLQPSALSIQNTKFSKLYPNNHSFFDHEYKIWSCTQTAIRCFEYKQRKENRA